MLCEEAYRSSKVIKTSMEETCLRQKRKKAVHFKSPSDKSLDLKIKLNRQSKKYEDLKYSEKKSGEYPTAVVLKTGEPDLQEVLQENAKKLGTISGEPDEVREMLKGKLALLRFLEEDIADLIDAFPSAREQGILVTKLYTDILPKIKAIKNPTLDNVVFIFQQVLTETEKTFNPAYGFEEFKPKTTAQTAAADDGVSEISEDSLAGSMQQKSSR